MSLWSNIDRQGRLSYGHASLHKTTNSWLRCLGFTDCQRVGVWRLKSVLRGFVSLAKLQLGAVRPLTVGEMPQARVTVPV
jgi:hypothetical protein